MSLSSYYSALFLWNDERVPPAAAPALLPPIFLLLSINRLWTRNLCVSFVQVSLLPRSGPCPLWILLLLKVTQCKTYCDKVLFNVTRAVFFSSTGKALIVLFGKWILWPTQYDRLVSPSARRKHVFEASLLKWYSTWWNILMLLRHFSRLYTLSSWHVRGQRVIYACVTGLNGEYLNYALITCVFFTRALRCFINVRTKTINE